MMNENDENRNLRIVYSQCCSFLFSLREQKQFRIFLFRYGKQFYKTIGVIMIGTSCVDEKNLLYLLVLAYNSVIRRILIYSYSFPAELRFSVPVGGVSNKIFFGPLDIVVAMHVMSRPHQSPTFTWISRAQ